MNKVQVPRLERGLRHFVDDIKECKNRDAEKVRVKKELEKIQEKFCAEKKLSAYEIRKYVCKLTYIRILGYDVLFGTAQVLKLACSSKIRDKALGYCAASILLTSEHDSDAYRMWFDMWSRDALSADPEAIGLALSAATNSGFDVIPETCIKRAVALLNDFSASDFLKRKAAACIIRYHQQYENLTADLAQSQVTSILMNRDFDTDQRLGAILILTALAKQPQNILLRRAAASGAAKLAIKLEKRANNHIPTTCTSYHGVYEPWLRVATVRLVSLEMDWNHDTETYNDLCSAISMHIEEPLLLSNVNAENARNAIRLEWLQLGARFEPLALLCRDALTTAAEQGLNANLSATAHRALSRLDGKPLTERSNLINLFDDPGEDITDQDRPRMSTSVILDLLTFDEDEDPVPALPPNPFGKSTTKTLTSQAPSQERDLLLAFDDVVEEGNSQPLPSSLGGPPVAHYNNSSLFHVDPKLQSQSFSTKNMIMAAPTFQQP
mmetsp:Transcript_10611/g.16026  ORF Transcript_10611/g.16026 Transcript_10611/m.16026 type:complete len:495 (-) Transcript_10611:102-1586(-)